MSKKKGHYTKHPSVYIDTYGEPHLDIFRAFFVETKLPKFENVSKDFKSAYDANIVINEKTDGSRRHETSTYYYERALKSSLDESKQKKSTIEILFSKLFSKKQKVEDTFDKIKKSLKLPTTKDMEESKQKADKLIKLLHDSGQYSQEEKVKDYAEVLKNEIVLIKNGYEKYLTEKDIIDVLLKSDKGVCITFLRYFSNILPLDVAQKKIEVDKLLAFDNYAVLYYDPNVDPFRFVKEKELERVTRDPILFGMIEGSDKLYYICDWVYKEDDLTMEKVEKMLGRKASLLKDAEIYNTNITISDSISRMEDILNEVPSPDEI